MSALFPPWRLLLAALPILFLLAAPLFGLIAGISPDDVRNTLAGAQLGQAFTLSLCTSGIAMLLVVIGGTPLAWWLARYPSPVSTIVRNALVVPLVLPPAALGVALLLTFGRNGYLSPLLEQFGIELAFSTSAVIIAQTLVAAPFYIGMASNAFSGIDEELLLVAKTLGQNKRGVFRHIIVPLAAPSLLSGLAFSWARAIGEFGATLLFAGNLPGQTQTMPLAIYAALEKDVHAAAAISLALAIFSVGVFSLFHTRKTNLSLGGNESMQQATPKGLPKRENGAGELSRQATSSSPRSIR